MVEAYPAVVTRPRFWTSSKVRFDTSTVVPLRSSSCLLPDPVNSRPFPSAFTTLPFEQSRRRWFGTSSCKPVPRGRPSSVEQLRTSSAFRLFAVLVAHCNRVPFIWQPTKAHLRVIDFTASVLVTQPLAALLPLSSNSHLD